MNVRDKKGSITIFVLVGLLFMTGFLIISFGSNINKSKSAKEQFNIISSIYSRGDGDSSAYKRAYTELRKGTRQTMNAYSDNSSTLELTKTYTGNFSEFIIYGNSIQDGTPSPDNPVEIQSVGDLVTDTTDENYGKYEIPVKVTGKNLVNIPDMNIKYTGYYQNYFPNNPKLLLQPSTQYTVSFDYVINSATTTVKCGIGYGTSYYAVDIVYGQAYPNQTKGRFEYTFTTPATFSSAHTPYLQLRFARAETSATLDVDISNIQVELGSYATEYETYKEKTFNIYLDEPLRKVGAEADYIDFSTGTLVRKIKEREISILGTEGDGNSHVYHPGGDEESYTSTTFFGEYLDDRKAGNDLGLCNIGKSNIMAIQLNNGEYVWFHNGEQYAKYTYFRLSNSRLDTTDEITKTESARDFLESVNCTVAYILATPTEETINLSELPTFEDYTKIEILTNIAPSKMEVEYIGYVFVEKLNYIESTGTQYIDTGYIPKKNTKVELTLSFSGEFLNSGTAFLGSMDGDNTFAVNFGSLESQSNQLYPWSDKTYASGATAYPLTITDDIKNNRNLMIIQSGSFSYGGIEKTIATKTEDHSTVSIALFGRNKDGVIAPFASYNMKLYSCKIYEGDTLVRNYIPYKSGDEIGLYDTVQSKFYNNNGTGSFYTGQ